MSTCRSPSRRSRRRFRRAPPQAIRRRAHARRWDKSCRYGRARASGDTEAASRHPEARAERASKDERPAYWRRILRGPRSARAPQDDGTAYWCKHHVLLMPHHIFPTQERRRHKRDQPIRGLADDGEGNDGGDDFGRLTELLAVDQQITETFGRTHQ